MSDDDAFELPVENALGVYRPIPSPDSLSEYEQQQRQQ
jgi:hypothetical protein